MTSFIALLRAVNVGGTGKLPMSALVGMCERAGFMNVRTYIASGNVAFESKKSEAQVKAKLAADLEAYAGKRVGVMVRTGAEMAAVLEGNPFAKCAPNRTVAIFLDEVPAKDVLKTVVGQNGEEVRVGVREIYVYYGEGMATSKLRIPGAKEGTARNMNTVRKLAAMAGEDRAAKS